LEAVRALVRAHVAPIAQDRYLHTDLSQAIALVRSGELLQAIVGVDLPGIVQRT